MPSEIYRFKNIEDLSRRAAELFWMQAERSILEEGRFLISLNGGNTPNRLFELLGTEYRDEPSWTNIHVFWGDERCVRVDDPESNYGQASEAFLKKVSIPESNIHRVNTSLGAVEAAKDYSLTLKRFASHPFDFPIFDLIYLGMGEDGHTASLFPGSPVEVNEAVLPVTAHYQDRPAHRVTMTQNVINRARMVVFMVNGAKKAGTLAEVLAGRYKPERYPAQRIAPKEGRLIWLIDEDAAEKLPKEIIKIFYNE